MHIVAGGLICMFSSFMQVAGIGRGASAVAAGTKTAKVQPGQLRMQRELSELDLPACCQLTFPDPKDLMNFSVTIVPDEGLWRGAAFKFVFLIKNLYPHDAPKVKCETLIYHPNIDLEGNVCLNILREDWKPILCISAVIYGLLHLLLEPNANDPLNQEAAETLRSNPGEFSRRVAQTLRGATHQGKRFPKLL